MLTVNTILHPTDFSESSEAAFRLACSFARAYGARLIILHVYPRPVTVGEVADRRLSGDPEAALMTKLYDLQPTDREIEVVYRLVEGNAADVIPDVATQEQCDLIVMGTHGRSGLRRAVMGSVAEAVTRRAHCPVATVRPSVPVPLEPATSATAALDSSIDLGVGDPVREVAIPVGPHTLRGTLQWAGKPRGIVVFAHGSGSSRHSPRNQFVAGTLVEAGFATLLMDLLTAEEGEDREKVFDVELLANRLAAAAKWVVREPEMVGLPVGYFGASTGSAAALIAAAAHPDRVSAVVSRGGRPDLAWDDLSAVRAPTLLIVGGADEPVLNWNRDALEQLTCPKELAVVSGATHLFEEPGALEAVAELARDWFIRHLRVGSEVEAVPVGQ